MGYFVWAYFTLNFRSKHYNTMVGDRINTDFFLLQTRQAGTQNASLSLTAPDLVTGGPICFRKRTSNLYDYIFLNQNVSERTKTGPIKVIVDLT